MPASAIVLGSLSRLRSPELLHTPIFVAYGDEDDHLRLTVLIAERLHSADEDAARACRQRRASWPDRLQALGRLLTAWRGANPAASAVLVDPDVLAPERAPDLAEDPGFLRARREFLDAVLQSAREGGWRIVRSSPRSELADAFADFEVQALGDEAEAPSALAGIVPAMRPIAAWLTGRGALGEGSLTRLLNSTDAPDKPLFEKAVAELPAFAQETAARLSILRPEQTVNGHYGPFSWATSERAWLRRDAVKLLCESGMLQPGLSEHAWVMPAAIRLRWQALRRERTPEGEARGDDAAAYAWLCASERTEDTIEAHHHAVEADDLDGALATARFYGSDLRALAIRLGRSAAAAKDPGRFQRAADLYRKIVSDFDDTDAYCWEYLAFNLARAQETGGTTAAPREIEDAYRRAHEFAPGNPLFHGRLIGYRAAQGQFDMGAIEALMGSYRQVRGALGIAYFGQPIIDGLRRCGRTAEAAELKQRWRIPPARRPAPAPKQLRRFGSARGTIWMSEDFDAPLDELGPYGPD